MPPHQKLTGRRRSAREDDQQSTSSRQLPRHRKAASTAASASSKSAVRPSKLIVPRPKSKQAVSSRASSTTSSKSPSPRGKRASSSTNNKKRNEDAAEEDEEVVTAASRSASKKKTQPLTTANLKRKTSQEASSSSKRQQILRSLNPFAGETSSDEDEDAESFVRPSYSKDFISSGEEDDQILPKKSNKNNKKNEDDGDTDDVRSFQSLSIGQIPAETNTHGYIFLDYENINFHPRHLVLFLAALESVLKAQLRNHRMTFSVVACAPYFLFQDDKVWIRDQNNTPAREPYQVCKRLAGIALEVLNNANVDCKVIPTNKREQADKKIMLDQLIAAVNPTSAQHHHFVVVSSDVGFGSPLRSILNVPGWKSKVTASIVHNLPLDNSHLIDLENAVGGPRNVLSVAELMERATNILLKPPPKHFAVNAASKKAKEERAAKMAEVIPLKYGVLWRPMRFDNEVIFHAPEKMNECSNNNNNATTQSRSASSQQHTTRRQQTTTQLPSYHQNEQSYLYQSQGAPDSYTNNNNNHSKVSRTYSSTRTAKSPAGGDGNFINNDKHNQGQQQYQHQHRRNSQEAYCKHCGSPDHLSRRCALAQKNGL